MADVFQFRRRLPDMGVSNSPKEYNKQLQSYAIDQRHLAQWLRQLADYVESDQVEVEPRAAVLVWSGLNQSEVLTLGYDREGGVKRSHAVKAMNRCYHSGWTNQTQEHDKD